MSVEGALHLELALHGGRIGHVALTSSRPVHASRIFHGKDVVAIGLLMPRLFSVCATAQACAATQAVAAARGSPVESVDRLAHRLLLLMETAQEHAWRLCIDGARLAGEPPRMVTAGSLRALLGRLQRALFPHGGWEGAALAAPGVAHVINDLDELLQCELFGVTGSEWCKTPAESPRWWLRAPDLGARLLRAVESRGLESLGKVPPRFLAPEEAERLEERLAGDDADTFIAAPTLDGEARETTPLARHWNDPALALVRAAHGAGLATRLTALLLELASTPQRMRELLAAGAPPAMGLSRTPGSGFASVEAARGLLCHRVELDGDRVVRYQILAPTEWNFHPRGVVAESLRNFPVRDAAAARNASELIVQAVDPCVGFEVTVHA